MNLSLVLHFLCFIDIPSCCIPLRELFILSLGILSSTLWRCPCFHGFSVYPNLKDFYWAKEALRKLCGAKDKKEALRQSELVIMNLNASDDAKSPKMGKYT